MKNKSKKSSLKDVGHKKESKLSHKKRKLEAEWIVTQKILGELITNDFSYDSWNSKKNNGLLDGKISWEMWKRYYKENKDSVLSQLKDSLEYRDFDGSVIQLEEFLNKPTLKLPCSGKLISKFAVETGDILKETKTIFFRPDSMDLVEVGVYYNNNGNEINSGFISVNPSRFITLIEKYSIPGNNIWKPATKERDGHWKFKEKSMNSELSKVVLTSSFFQNKMPNIERIFTVPIPIIYNGKLSFPKVGFDERFNSWLPFDSPKIEDGNMTLDEAKKIIEDLYSEFCFKDKQDLANAIAAAITPFCRGLFSNFNIRSPITFYKGNRERVGKDHCAGVTGIIYEGYSLSEPPISSGESGNNNEELRKKLLAAMMEGRRRLHFANNKGKINNSVFEAVTTETVWSDRILGGNKMAKFNNEIDFSLSGNTNVTLTADLENRCLFINLFLDIENANDRVFNNPDLHKFVSLNRGKIISAFYAFIKNWINMGSIGGTIPFASFPEWSRIVGGIIECAGYENPCNIGKNTQLSINDPEKDYMKQIHEYFYKMYPNRWIKKELLKNEIKKGLGGLDIFPYLNFDLRRDQMKLSSIIDSYNGRILCDIKFSINDMNLRGQRQEVIFEKKAGNLVTFGNLKPRVFLGENNNYKGMGSKVAKVAKVTHQPKQFKPLKDMSFMITKNKTPTELILKKSHTYNENILGDNPQDTLKILLKNKDIKLT